MSEAVSPQNEGAERGDEDLRPVPEPGSEAAPDWANEPEERGEPEPQPQVEEAPDFESEADRESHFESEAERESPLRGAREPERERYAPPPRRPASPAVVSEAIEDVNRVIETLKQVLDDMEEVLETLELAERQKTADEQEIETLRRSLRHMQKPREGGQPHHGRRH